jgi:AcrR family transcriptional regulator
VPDPKRTTPSPDGGPSAHGREPAADKHHPSPGAEAADPARDAATRGERPARDRDRGAPGRDRGTRRSRPRAPIVEGRPDDLWPPFSVPWSDRDARTPGSPAHPPSPHEHAERELLGARRGRGRNRVVPSLSRGEIVDAAIAVADAEGADAVSMRRIAQVLRAGTMSLYWHVTNKERLLDLMLDALAAEVRVPDASGDWRADLQAVARENRAMLLRHPWVMDFVGGRPPLGPNTMLNLDRSLAMLDDLGVDTGLAFNILEAVLTYVLGATLREVREMHVQRVQELSGISPEEWAPLHDAWRDRLDADGRFSHVVRFLDQGIDPDAEETRDERFEFGLDCVLDGIAGKIGRSEPGRVRQYGELTGPGNIQTCDGV